MTETTRLRLWTLFRIPLLFFLRPSVLEASAARTVVRIPLTRRSRNHLGSMYFGALCAAALRTRAKNAIPAKIGGFI